MLFRHCFSYKLLHWNGVKIKSVCFISFVFPMLSDFPGHEALAVTLLHHFSTSYDVPTQTGSKMLQNSRQTVTSVQFPPPTKIFNLMKESFVILIIRILINYVATIIQSKPFKNIALIKPWLCNMYCVNCFIGGSAFLVRNTLKRSAFPLCNTLKLLFFIYFFIYLFFFPLFSIIQLYNQ